MPGPPTYASLVVHTAEIISAAGFSQGQCHKWQYILPSPCHAHTHTRKATASVDAGMQMWSWWEQKRDDGRDWVGNIQGGSGKFLGHLIRHCGSRILSESSKQDHIKRINQTVSTKSEFYSIFLSFIVRILLSNIRSGSSFRVTMHASRCFQMLPLFATYYCAARVYQ